MSNKRPSLISGILTIVLLTLIGLVLLFVELIALNGFSTREGMIALGTAFTCQTVTIILAGVFAGWLTRLVITKFNWNSILVVVMAVVAGTFLGGVISFLAVIFSIMLVGV